MQGGHDLGGKQGLGPINPESEAEEPVFHADWERRIFALTLATGMLGKWNIDQSRFARERQHPINYLENSYYENWYEGVSKLLVENGLISEAELFSGASQQMVSREFRVPTREDVKKILSSGGPTEMWLDLEPVFIVGDYVIFGGFSGAHQYCKIGAHSFLGMYSGVARDLPPYVIVMGQPAEPRGINLEGLKRRDFNSDQIRNIKTAYKYLYMSELRLEEAISKIQAIDDIDGEITTLFEFLKDATRGIVRKN